MTVEQLFFLCRYRTTDGECGTPIILDAESPSGFSHAEGRDWCHWAAPMAYGPQDSQASFVKRAMVEGLKVEEGASVTPNPPSINANQTNAEQFHKDILSIYGARSQTALRVVCREIFMRRELEAFERGQAAQHLKREQEGRRTTQEIAEAVVASYNGGFVREMQRVPRPGLVALVKEALDGERGQPREQEPAPRTEPLAPGQSPEYQDAWRINNELELRKYPHTRVLCLMNWKITQPPQELVSRGSLDEYLANIRKLASESEDPELSDYIEEIQRLLVKERAAPEEARAALTRGAVGGRCNFYFGGFDGGKRCQKPMGHDGNCLWEVGRAAQEPK